MQQLNVHDYYELGKKVDVVEQHLSRAEGPTLLSNIAWLLFVLRWHLFELLTEPCALLPASQRAARAVIDAIGHLIPAEVGDIFKIEKNEEVQPYHVSVLEDAIKNFETVLKNDMPEMSTFAVAQIGIFRTEDLIHRSYLQITEDVRPILLPLALFDITEAGKCLAFRLPTAAAFHMSRAIETGMNQYFEALADKPLDLKPAANNWGTKIQTLRDNGGEEKITEFLTHIRKAYRNPITHPEVIVEPSEAFGFFSQAVSVISLMLIEVRTLREKRQPRLPGMAEVPLTKALTEC